MLPFGGGTPLTDEQLRQLASYVLSKRGIDAGQPEEPATRNATRRAGEPERASDQRRSVDDARDVPRRAGQHRTATAGASGSTRASRPGRYYRARTLVSLVAARVPASRRRSCAFRGQPLVLLNVLERRFVLFGIAVLAAGLLSRRPGRARGPRHAGAVHGRGRAGLVRLAVPADRVHGDAVPPDRVPDRRLGRAAAAARSRPVDARPSVAHGVQARALLRPVVRDRQPVPGLHHRRRARSGRSSPTRRARTSQGWSRSPFSACCSTASSRASASRPACWPVRTGGSCRR